MKTQQQIPPQNKFQYWLNYFKNNENHFDDIFWDGEEKLTPHEIRIISSSIQQFQKGENSEGKHLIAFAKKIGDQTYLETIKLFIKEEQKHALVLSKLMKTNNISRIKSHWIDDVFRGLRKLASLENSIIVLLTAEIIASVYYIALKECSNSKTLKAICNQILLDEEMHINFQSYTLGQFYKTKSSLNKIFSRYFHRILMTGTTCMVWLYHWKVLKHGGFPLQRFYKSVFTEYSRSEKMIKEEHLIIRYAINARAIQI
ncbi:MAG: hypothetical protein ACON5F_03370 [Jejuia sp.]